MKIDKYTPKFVEYIPLELEVGVLYISMTYATATHLCVCGCKQKVITPLSPRAWSLMYDGEGVTLSPSIGNYEQDCLSHYFIRKNHVIWCLEDSSQTGASFKKKSKKRKRKWLKFWNK